MICPKCQAENPPEAEFCSLCYARFVVQVRSSEADEKARRMNEKHQGSRLRCPSCQALSPLDSQFCLRCGFVFEDLEGLMVSEEEIEKMEQEAREREHGVEVNIDTEPIVVTMESEGATVMRHLADHLGRGMHPRIHASGRNAITYALKIIALLGEDIRSKGSDIRMRVKLISEGSVTYIDDVELELVLEIV